MKLGDELIALLGTPAETGASPLDSLGGFCCCFYCLLPF